MSLQSGLAAASGAAAVGMSGLLITQRFEGSAPAALLLAWGATAAAHACSIHDEDPPVRADASLRLQRHGAFAPAAIFALAAGCIRAGSASLADIAGAHAVAGLSLIRGPFLTVAGMWLAVIGAAIAVGGATETVPGERYAGARIRMLSTVALSLVFAALFAGPQVRGAMDVVVWTLATIAIALWGLFGRIAASMPSAPVVAGSFAAAGLALVIMGGAA